MINLKKENERIKEEQKEDKYYQFLESEIRKSNKYYDKAKYKESKEFASGYTLALETCKAEYLICKGWKLNLPFS